MVSPWARERPPNLRHRVQLPFALDASGSSAVLDRGTWTLTVRLKVLPLAKYVEGLREEKPLSFGQIGLGSAGLFDLE